MSKDDLKTAALCAVIVAAPVTLLICVGLVLGLFVALTSVNC
jgi:flagellar biosynthesis protein FliQ